jgi:hypothetical protein
VVSNSYYNSIVTLNFKIEKKISNSKFNVSSCLLKKNMDNSINNSNISSRKKTTVSEDLIFKKDKNNHHENQSLLILNSTDNSSKQNLETFLFENEFNKENDKKNCLNTKSFSMLSPQKKAQSDIDSKINTLDNQSDISRYKNDVNGDNDDDDDDGNNNEDQEEKLLFPGFVKKSCIIFTQQSKPRFWCLKMITSPWFERISMLVILINCFTLGMYQPCEDNPCVSTRCKILQYCDHFIYAFFSLEMLIKIMAMGFIGKETYLAETWNRLDFFIVIAG